MSSYQLVYALVSNVLYSDDDMQFSIGGGGFAMHNWKSFRQLYSLTLKQHCHVQENSISWCLGVWEMPVLYAESLVFLYEITWLCE